jgi:hypothetical protein
VSVVERSNGRGAGTFLVAAAKKQRRELQAILASPEKLTEVATYHNIKPEWARFYITEELNRNERRG